MKFLVLVSFLMMSCLSCTHKEKPSDPVVSPNPPAVEEATQEKTIFVYFKFNSSKLTEDQKKIIKEELAARKEGTKVLIVGHADSQGSDAYNLKLSAKRAKEVSKYLDSLKIDNEWMAKGEKELLNADKTKAEHKLNRRAFLGFTILVK